jgi:hypothetical protein
MSEHDSVIEVAARVPKATLCLLTAADLAALTARVRRRVIAFFKRQGFPDAHAAADMLAWENSGFSIDASVRITLLPPHVRVYRQSLEHLLRYCARPPFALERLSAQTPASLSRSLGPEPPAAAGRHGSGGRERRQAVRSKPGPIRKILTHLGEPLEPNILVAPCPITCDHWKNVQRKNDTAAADYWLRRAKQLKHPSHLWNYWHHPDELGVVRSHKVFPQFSPTHIHRLARSYGQNNVDGVFLCGWGEGLDFYALRKCFDDPNLNLDALRDEYFTLSFGLKAGSLLEQFYRRIETISMEPMNGPVEVNEQFF